LYFYILFSYKIFGATVNYFLIFGYFGINILSIFLGTTLKDFLLEVFLFLKVFPILALLEFLYNYLFIFYDLGVNLN